MVGKTRQGKKNTRDSDEDQGGGSQGIVLRMHTSITGTKENEPGAGIMRW